MTTTETKTTPAYLRPKPAAEYLGISESLLSKKQVRMGQGPRGGKLVAQNAVGGALSNDISTDRECCETRSYAPDDPG